MNHIYHLFNVPVDFECMPYPDSLWYAATIHLCEFLDSVGILYTWSC